MTIYHDPTELERIPLEDAAWVDSYHLAHEALRSPKFASALHNRLTYPIFGHSVLTLSGTAHLERRRTEMPLVLPEAIKRYENEAVLPTLRASIAAAIQAGEGETVVVDLVELVQLALLRVTTTMVGIDGVHDDADARRFREIAVALGNVASVEFSTGDRQALVDAALEAKERFVREYYTASRRRRLKQLDSAPDDTPDLLTLLSAYPGWDDDELVRECVFYVTASSSTTTNATPHFFRELSQWFAEHPEDRPRVDDICFMQRAASETLRLYPPIPALIRRALDDVTLSDGTTVRSGELLVVDLNKSNRDPEVFGPDAAAFNPLRSIPSRVQPWAVSFSLGPHACLGRPIAVGSGQGTDTGDDPIRGVLVLVVQELFRHGATLSSEPPTVREEMEDLRYSRFPIELPRRGS